MRRVPWPQWWVSWLAAVVLAGGVAAVWAHEQEPEIETVVRDVVVLPEGQTKVTGTAARLEVVDAVGPPLDVPLTFTTGRSVVDGALVHGERVTIEWDGGRPFRLSGGALDLGPSRVAIAADGTATWTVDDGPRLLLPGTYRIDSPVAVGTAGLARPVDGVTFTADDETVIDLTGTGPVVVPPRPLTLTGPGSIVAEGAFELTDRDGTRQASQFEFGPGPFEVALSPGGGTLSVRGTLQGPLRASAPATGRSPA